MFTAKEALRPSNVNILSAENGLVAVETFKDKERIDLVLMT